MLGLGLSGLSQSKTAASDLLGFAFGPLAQKALALLILRGREETLDA